MATQRSRSILDLVLVAIVSRVHGLRGLPRVLGQAGLAGDQVHHIAGLTSKPVPDSVLKSSEGASKPG